MIVALLVGVIIAIAASLAIATWFNTTMLATGVIAFVLVVVVPLAVLQLFLEDEKWL